MRRPDIELDEAVARYIEQHPEAVALLAGRAHAAPAAAPAGLAARRDRFRAYIRQQRDRAGTSDTAAGADAFLARFRDR